VKSLLWFLGKTGPEFGLEKFFGKFTLGQDVSEHVWLLFGENI
jgi:hypothetical protein